MIHDPGRGAPVAKIQFLNAYRYKRDTQLMVATEDMYTGQFIYCVKMATLTVEFDNFISYNRHSVRKTRQCLWHTPVPVRVL